MVDRMAAPIPNALRAILNFDCILSHREVNLPLFLTFCLQRCLVFSKTSTNGTGFLGTEIKRQKLLVLEHASYLGNTEESELCFELPLNFFLSSIGLLLSV